MKKLLSIVAGASLLASTAALADGHGGGPKVYGGVSASISLLRSVKDEMGEDDDRASGHFVNDETSRLGVKGSSKISDGLNAIYQVELGIPADGGGRTTRDTFVGLQGGFGTFKIGRISAFANGVLGGSSVADRGLVAAAVRAPGQDAAEFDADTINGDVTYLNGLDGRHSNAIEYVTPNFAGFQLGLTLSPDERGAYEVVSSADTSTITTSNIADNYQFGVKYASPIGINVAISIAQDSNNRYTTVAGTNNGVRYDGVADISTQAVNIGYKQDSFKVGVLVATYDDGRDNAVNAREEVDMTGLYADLYLGAVSLGVNLGSTTIAWPDVTREDADVTFAELAVTYQMNSSMKFFGNYTSNTVSGGELGSGGMERQNEATELKVGFKSSF